MYKNRSQGFTLIELLVVIAIIGILSAVVLASLNTARSKGNDAAIQSDLSAVQTEAEIYYGGVGVNSYGSASITACPAVTVVTTTLAGGVFTDQTIMKAIAGAESANGAGVVTCHSNTTAYAIDSALQAGIGGKMFWCVDSTGNAKPEAAAMLAAAFSCL